MKAKNISYAIAIVLVSLSMGLYSQPSPPPELPDKHGKNGNVSQNAAPVGDGAEILIVLGGIYLLTRVWAEKKKVISGA